MSLGRFLLKSAILVLVFSHSYGQQPCNNCCQKPNHKEIDNSRRSVESKWKSGQAALCDKDLAEGWYRFTSFVGGRMPTKKVNINRCGTQSPIWLDGTTGNHPASPNDPVVSIRACVNFRERRKGCFFKFDVSVKRCSGNPDFFVYYLKPTPQCDFAYCSGDGKPCPYGQSGTSLATCGAGPQKISSIYLGHPEIKFKNSEDEQVSLLCVVPIDMKIRTWKNVTYEIEWYADGKKTKFTERPFCKPAAGQKENNGPCPDKEKIHSLLEGRGNNYEPGQWISCEVKAKFTTLDTHPWSDIVAPVKPLFAGIKVTPSTLIISECKEPFYQELTLTPMIPVRKNKHGHYLYVKFYLPDGLWLLNKEECSVELKETTPVTVKIGATCTTLYGLRKAAVVTPWITNYDQSDFWGYFGLPTVWVTVVQKDQPIHKCKSVTDPHYRMLDRQNVPRERWHDFFGFGDFILYHNKEKNFEVLTRQWACNNAKSITCNCGVIIRDHNDLIKFSCCGNPRKTFRDDTTPIVVDIPRAKCLAPGITLHQVIQGINSKYEVIVPSGIKVVLERNYWGIDVTIYTPRAKNRQKEDGLCTYENRHGDITTFGNNLRRQPSYFDKLPPEINKQGSTLERACACDETTDKGKTKECADGGVPVFWPTGDTNKFNRIKRCDNSPQERDLQWSDDLTEADYELFLEPLDSEVHKRQRRSANVISKENATRYCAERLAETPVGKMCAKLGTNVQALVNVCASDIEYTGDLSFAIGAVSMLMDECNDVIIENITVNSNDTGNFTAPKMPKMPPAVQQIAQLLCPNDCTFNGKCVNGSCVCNKDYTAEDCAISVYQKPFIARLQSNGLCDRRKRPCKKVIVQGTGFLNSTNMTCHIKEFEVVNSSWIPNKNETKYPGIMTDLVLVECFLPDSPVLRTTYDENLEGTPASGLLISVSNNAIHQSEQELKLISYDSVCMECNISTGCSLKNNSCFINRYCFSLNEPNPKDWCEQCLPNVDTNTWSKRQVNHPPNVTSTTVYYVVYGESLELPIEVTDPEEMPVTVSLTDGSPPEALVQNNILFWNVTTNKTTRFFFRATDACQASSTLNISVIVNVCPCLNGGRCVPRTPRGRGLYECSCSPGFTGQYCSTDIDECKSYPCLRGQCIDQVNNYTCSCDLGFEGRNCDVDIDFCQSSPCVKGNCTDQVSGYTCSCVAGYSGLQCDLDVNECSSSPCVNNGTCLDQVNGFSCQCLPGYAGHNCNVNIDECQSSPCANNGSCVDKINAFNCTCLAGFNGSRCEENINECLQVSCGNGTCLDRVNNYTCVCNVGYAGRHCDVPIVRCSNDTCYPGVPCFEKTTPVFCGPCLSGFTGDGKNCKDIDDCLNHSCANGGSCVDGINNYTCSCLTGFTGHLCSIDIDDCVIHTCAYGGICVDGVNNYSCSCVTGYTGNHCEKDIDDCVNHTCVNGGFCIDAVNDYRCNCSSGFTGARCENNIDDCLNVSCKHGGSCIDGINNFSCSCPAGYTGIWCETDINECVSNKCANGSTCQDDVNQYTCLCHEGFTGHFCENEIPFATPPPTESSSTEKPPSEGTSRPTTAESISTEKPPSEGTSRPTTADVAVERKTDFTIEIRVSEEWDDRLTDTSSEKFKELAIRMKQEIRKAYSGDFKLKEVVIISMRKGSIIAEFQLKFDKEVTAEEALAPLKKETADGKLGSLKVDPGSLKETDRKKADDDDGEEKPSIGRLVIIGASIGGLVVVAVLMIGFYVYCKRTGTPSNGGRFEDGMPDDDPCEKYELKPADDEKEHITSMEEKGIYNHGVE